MDILLDAEDVKKIKVMLDINKICICTYKYKQYMCNHSFWTSCLNCVLLVVMTIFMDLFNKNASVLRIASWSGTTFIKSVSKLSTAAVESCDKISNEFLNFRTKYHFLNCGCVGCKGISKEQVLLLKG